MTIYIDVIFLENTILNSILLVATAIMIKSKIHFFKILLVSMIGSACSIVQYIVSWKYGSLYIFKILISIFMVYSTFKSKTLKKFIKQLLMFYLISFTFGGISYMLLFEVNPSKLILKANHFVGLYPIKISIIAGVFGIVIFTIFAKLFKKNFLEKNIVYKIEIGYLERKVQLNVLLDSGNLLKAPISNEDVIIVEKKSLKDLLSLDILKNINNIINGKWIDNNVSNDNYEANGTNEERKGSNNIYEKRNDDNEENSIDEKRNIRLIPFSSLGNENGVLFGFKPDYVKIYSDEEKMQKNVIVGVYNGKLTKTNLYSGLIGLNLLEGESKHEFIKSA